MGFAFVPVYVRLLGVEAYGLIGIFSALIAWLALLDAGLKPALARGIAQFTGGGEVDDAWDLLRSIEILCVGVGVMIGLGALICANFIATSWISATQIQYEVITYSVAYMGVIAGLRFVEGIYSSCLSGLQRHVSMNAISIVMATIRSFGAVAVLTWIESSLKAFFVWQLIISLITLLICWRIAYQAMPTPRRRPRFSIDIIVDSWRFAGGMLLITFLALMLTQIDKILLSTLITLEDFGKYTLASIAASALFTLITPITVTFLPRLTQLYATRQDGTFAKTFHQGAQMVTVIGGSVASVVICNSETLLRVWLQDSVLAHQTSSLLSLLLAGNLMNGLCHMPYQAQLAHGITRFAVLVNACAAAVLIPLIFIIVPIHGAIGAAAIWASLNLCYLVVNTIFVSRFVLNSENKYWFMGDISRPLLVSVTIAALGSEFVMNDHGNFFTLLSLALLTLVTFLISLFVSKDLFEIAIHRLRIKGIIS
jgi:O-antigen/teichoic acid export membrane protein